MAESNPTDCRRTSPDSPGVEDGLVESIVLAFVLDQHPTHLTVSELALAMSQGNDDFAAADAVERAIRDLVCAGLLRIACDLVLPTRAALYFDGLGVD